MCKDIVQWVVKAEVFISMNSDREKELSSDNLQWDLSQYKNLYKLKRKKIQLQNNLWKKKLNLHKKPKIYLDLEIHLFLYPTPQESKWMKKRSSFC
jgi:hypothetical protein